DDYDEFISKKMELMKHNLDSLGLQVSTGKIVDFRSKDLITNESNKNSVPLLRPSNLKNYWITNMDSNAENIVINDKSRKILLESGNYVVLKRFTTKEERKRIVASLLLKEDYNYDYIALENRLNYFHTLGKGIDKELAKGLTLYLNSTFVDKYFRLYIGHTQVNAN